MTVPRLAVCMRRRYEPVVKSWASRKIVSIGKGPGFQVELDAFFDPFMDNNCMYV